MVASFTAEDLTVSQPDPQKENLVRSPHSSRRELLQIGLLAFGLGLITGSGSRADEPAEEKYETPTGATPHDFKSGGAKIRVLHFEPPGTEKRPVVIML